MDETISGDNKYLLTYLLKEVSNLTSLVQGMEARLTLEEQSRSGGDSTINDSITGLQNSAQQNSVAITNESIQSINRDSVLDGRISELTDTHAQDKAQLIGEIERHHADQAQVNHTVINDLAQEVADRKAGEARTFEITEDLRRTLGEDFGDLEEVVDDHSRALDFLTADNTLVTADSDLVSLDWSVLSASQDWRMELDQYMLKLQRLVDTKLNSVQQNLDKAVKDSGQALENSDIDRVVGDLLGKVGSDMLDDALWGTIKNLDAGLVDEIKTRSEGIATEAAKRAHDLAEFASQNAQALAAESQERIEALARESSIRADQMLAQAEELQQNADNLVAQIQLETSARAKAIAREALDRANAINQAARDAASALAVETQNRIETIAAETTSREAQILAQAQALQAASDLLLARVQDETNSRTQQIKAERNARIAAIELLDLGLTKEQVDRLAGDKHVLGELTNYKNANDTALANVRKEVSTVTTTQTAQAKRMDALDVKVNDVNTTAASAVSKADALADAHGSQASKLTSLEARMLAAEGSIETGAEIDASLFDNFYTKTKVDEVVAGQLTNFNASMKIGGANVLTNSEAPRTGSNEYLLYEKSEKLCAFYDKHLGQDITISFEVSVPVAGSVQVYCANGSRHHFTASVNVSADEVGKFVYRTVTIKPKLHSSAENQALTTSNLEFYGTYDTGRKPTVRLVQVEAGNKATAWRPSASDVATALDANAQAIQNTNTEVTRVNGLVQATSSSLEKLTGQVTENNTNVASELKTVKRSVTNLEGSTNTSVQNLKSSFEKQQAVSSTNLWAYKNASGTQLVKNPDYTYTVAKTSLYSGVCIPSPAEVASGSLLVLSYKLKVISGRLTQVGGHCAGFEVLNVYVNGQPTTSGSDTVKLPSSVASGGTVDVVVFLKRVPHAGESNLWIQPNRGLATAVTAKVYEVQLEQGTARSPWALSTVDSEQQFSSKLDADVINQYSTTSDMNNAIATGVSSYVAGLTLGGNNLQTNSQFDNPSAKNGWNYPYGTTKVTGGKLVGTTTKPDSANRLEKVMDGSQLEVGKTYTLSILAKSPVALDLRSHDGVTQISKITPTFDAKAYQKYVVTFKVIKLPATIRAYVPNLVTGGQVSLDWEKLEEGLVASAWSPASSEVDENIKANAKAISTTDTRVKSLEGVTTSQSSNITTLQNGLAATNAQVALKANALAVSGLTNTVTQQGKDINSQGNAITKLKNVLDTTNGALNTKASADTLSSLDSKVTQIDGKVVSNASDITSLKNRATAVEGTLKTKADSSALASLNSTVTQQGKAVNAQGDSLTRLQNSLEATDKLVSSKADNSAVSNLGSRVTSAEGSITSQAKKLTELQASLGAADGKLSGRITTNASAISNTDSTVKSINGRVVSNSNAITTLRNDVTALDGKVSKKAEASAVSELVSTVKQQGSELNSHSSSLTKLDNSITVTNANVTKAQQAVEDAKKTADGAVKDAANALGVATTKANASSFNALDQKVTTIGGKVTSNADSITSLNGKMATVTGALTTKVDSTVLVNYYTKTQTNSAIAGSINKFNSSLELGGENLYLGPNPIPLGGETSSGLIKSTGADAGTMQWHRYLDASWMDLSIFKAGDNVIASVEVLIPNGSVVAGHKLEFGTYRFASAGYLKSNPIFLKDMPKDKWVKLETPAGKFPSTTTEVAKINISFWLHGRSVGTAFKFRNLMLEKATKASSYKDPQHTVNSALSANADAIKTTNTNVSTIDGRVKANSNSITSLNSRLNSAESGLVKKADSSALNSLDSKVTKIDGRVTANASSIATLRADLTEADKLLGTVNTATAKAQNTANTAVTKADAAANAVSSLRAGYEAKVGSLASADAANAANIAKTNSDLTSAKKALATADTALGSRINTLTTTVANNDTSVRGKIKDVADSVTTLEGSTNSKLTSLESGLSGLNTTVGTKASASAVNALTSRVSNVEGVSTSHSGSINTLKSGLTNLDELSQVMNSGKLLYTDPTFKLGMNNITTYNNSKNSNVIVARRGKSADNPTTSSHELLVKTIGAASPAHGGIIAPLAARPNAVFLTKYIIKLPVGYTLLTAANSMGSGYKDKLYGQSVGTGKFEAVYRITRCGATGSFSDGGHLYVSGNPAPTTKAPLEWVVASVEVYDCTDFQAAPQPVLDAVATAQSTANTAVTGNKANANAISGLNTALSSLGTSVNGRIDTVSDSLTTLEGNTNTRFTKLTSELDSAGQKAQQGIKNAASAQNTANTAVTKTTNNASNITTLQGRMTTAEGNITKKAETSALKSLDSKVSVIDGKVTTNTSSITTLKGQVTSVEKGLSLKADGSALSSLTSRVSNAEGGISSQSSKLTKLEASVGNTFAHIIATHRNGGYRSGGIAGGVYSPKLVKAGGFSRGISLVVWAADGTLGSIRGFDTYATPTAIAALATALLALPVNTYFTLVGLDNVGANSAFQANANLKKFIVANGGSADYYATWGGTTLPIFTSMVGTGSATGIQHSFNSNVTNDWVKCPITFIGGIPEGMSGAQPVDASKFASASALATLDSKVVSIDGKVSSQASQITTLTSANAANKNALAVQAKVLNGVKSSYMVKMETNGVIGGFGLIQEATGTMGTVTSAFGVNADQFYVGAPASGKKVFAVVKGQTVINDAVIGNLNASKITTGTLSADRIGAGSITADKLKVTSLSALSADLGSFTSKNAQGSFTVSGTMIALRDASGNLLLELGLLS